MSLRASIRSFARCHPGIWHTVQGASRAYTRSAAVPLVARTPLAAGRFQVRGKAQATNAWATNPVIDYHELKPITEQPNDDILLVDVREPEEVSLGSIPSAVNLPLSVLKESLQERFTPGEFQRKFAFPKPSYNQNIIFFCRSGKRSATAAEQAVERGYPNVRNYTGSWLDWQKKEQGRDTNDD